MTYTVTPDGCWLWTGPTIKGVYGWWRDTTAHRAMWRESGRELPDGFDVHHTCPNKLCVNPEHMKLVEARQHRREHASRRQGGRSRHRGVYSWRQKWRGEYTHYGVRHRTKWFDDEDEAAEAIEELRRTLATGDGER